MELGKAVKMHINVSSNYFSINSVSMTRKVPHHKEKLLEGVSSAGKQRIPDDGHVGLDFQNIV